MGPRLRIPAAVSMGIVFVLTAATFAEQQESASPAIRLRMEWGGGSPRLWSGLLEVSQGRFENPYSLGVEADEPGTIWVDGRAVWIQRRTARVYDGFDITVVAAPHATLSMTLQSAGKTPVREQLKLPVGELDAAGEKIVPVGDSGARLVMRRRPGDALRVKIDRPHLIYKPGERFAADIRLRAGLFRTLAKKGRHPRAPAGVRTKHPSSARPNLFTPEPLPEDSRIQWQLTAARDKTALQQGARRIPSSADSAGPDVLPLEITLPQQEGAYDIRLKVSWPGVPEQTRLLQVLVLSEESRLRHARETMPGRRLARELRVDAFAPEKAGLFRRVARSRRGKRIADTAGKILDVLTGRDNPTAPSALESRTDWSAFWLKVRHPGRPHRLVVSAPAGLAQSLGISLLEPNAAGQLMPVGLDSGVYVDPSSAGSPAMRPVSSAGEEDAEQSLQHQMLVWPKSPSPLLLLHNLNSGRPFQVSHVELLELAPSTRQDEKPKAAPDAGEARSSHGEAVPVSVKKDLLARRLIGPYMHKPLLPENFGATEAYDASSRRSLDDWVTFHTAVLRLAEYLHDGGFNSFMLAVLADGSTIYPSRLLQPTPRYDTGVFFSTGQDPVRKDVLELLYRVFDREGLVLIPELQFSTPLPALEQALTRDGDRARGLELIGRDGRSWRETRGSARGLAPHYNPLDPRVQQAVLDVVGELVERYKSHPSFGGVAVELSSTGYLQFPGLGWGYDDETINRFEKATGIQLPKTAGPERYRNRFERLTGEHRGEWIRWRCQELSRFHRRLAQVVTQADPAARFILSGNRVLRGGNPDDDLYAALKRGERLEALLAPKGLDLSSSAKQERTTILRPSLWRVPESAAARSLDLEVNRNPSLNAAFHSRHPGVLFYHRPRECRLAKFDSVSPWQPAYTWLAAQASPAGLLNRKRYAHALAASDAQVLFDGGWMVPLGQEDETRGIRASIAELPAVTFHSKTPVAQPAVVRIARHGTSTFLYVVNDFPAHIDVRLDLSCSATTRLEHLGGRREDKLEPSPAAGSTIRLHLEPYDLWACELLDPKVHILEVEVSPAERALELLARQIHQFQQKVADVHRAPESQKTFLENPGFELAGRQQDQLPDWELPTRNAVFWSLDDDNPRSGSRSLMLASHRKNAAVLRLPLPATDSRSVTMSVWLRSNRAGVDVRLAYQASIDGRKHVQYDNVKVDRRWRRYQLQTEDFPIGTRENSKLTIHVPDTGKVWVDDVELQLNRLTPDEMRQLTKVYSAINLAWDEKRYADCRRLLEGYWARLLLEGE